MDDHARKEFAPGGVLRAGINLGNPVIAQADAEQGAWDVAFLAIDPERAKEIAFSDAYVHIEGAYMVLADFVARALEESGVEATVAAPRTPSPRSSP